MCAEATALRGVCRERAETARQQFLESRVWCAVLWWYLAVCRLLYIGPTSPNCPDSDMFLLSLGWIGVLWQGCRAECRNRRLDRWGVSLPMTLLRGFALCFCCGACR